MGLSKADKGKSVDDFQNDYIEGCQIILENTT